MTVPPAGAAELFNAGVAHMNAGRFPEALAAAEKFVRAFPAAPAGHQMLGAALLGVGRYADCRRACEKAIRLKPTDPRPHYQLATTLLREGKLADTHRAIDRAVKACGPDPYLAAVRAECLLVAGDYQAAYDACKPLINAGDLNECLAEAGAKACGRTGRHAEGVEILQRRLGKEGLSPMARGSILCVLAELCDALGRYDEAFAAMQAAHALKNRAPDPAAPSRAVDACIAAWSPDAVAALPRAPRTDLPVFIVGFWRSGTTLVEQTLSSHPGVFGAGELSLLHTWAHQRHDPRLVRGEPLITDLAGLSRDAIERLSRSYLAHIRRLAPRAARVTDKLPTNFASLGVISLAFPGPRVVHCVRDPADTCLSCYFNLHGNAPYAHDLAALGSFYRDYQRLMAHWKSVLGLTMLEVRYEDFVADQEGGARRLVDFVGLPWDDACLRPHENRRIALTRSIDQVRRPMYTSSIGRWKHYEKHLGRLTDALAEPRR
jgi:tetratricopeptide (TPR) repeat protein